MGKVFINFATEQFAAQFDALPAGEYRMLVTDIIVGNNDNGDMFTLKTEVLDEDVSGRKCSLWLVGIDAMLADSQKHGFRLQRFWEAFYVPFEECVFGFDLDTREYSGVVVSEPDDKDVRHLLGFALDSGKFIPVKDQILNVNLTFSKAKAGSEYGDSNFIGKYGLADPEQMIILDESPILEESTGRTDELV